MNRKLIAWPLAMIIVLTILATAAVPASAVSRTKTELTVSVPATVHSIQTFDITGQLLITGNVGLGDMPVSVYKSTDGETWSFVGTGLTGSDGYFTVQDLIPDPGQYFYRAIFAGDELYKKAKTRITTVTAESQPIMTAVYGRITAHYYEGVEYVGGATVTATYNTNTGSMTKTAVTQPASVGTVWGKFTFDALPVGVPIDFKAESYEHNTSWTTTLELVEGGYDLGTHQILMIHPPWILLDIIFQSGLTVSFNGGGSAMVDTFYWDWGDGSTSISMGGVYGSHTYAAPGTYDVTLTATNIAGSSTITKQVTV